MKLSLLAVLMAAMFVAPAGATPLVPVSDFSDASMWTASGAAKVAGGKAVLGYGNQVNCRGPEGSGIYGSLTHTLPSVLTATVEFDYSIYTMDTKAYSWVQVDSVSLVDGKATTLSKFNPNTSYGSCATRDGHAVIPVPLLSTGSIANLRLSVRGDAFGDPLDASIDNLAVGA